MSTDALPTQLARFPRSGAGEAFSSRRAGLAENSAVRGSMVIEPYGYAIWEAMQRGLDDRIKATGHQNAYFPLFIPPPSWLRRPSISRASPRTRRRHPGGREDARRAAVVRPTSETLIWRYASGCSYRDLPLLFNQWANVVRWELRARLFLRTSEFLWQEGHTAHETDEEAVAETLTILHDVYADTLEYLLAIPVSRPQERERAVPGAVDTYTLEALMRDGKALQAATSHDLGQNFARAFDIKFTGGDMALPGAGDLLGGVPAWSAR